MPAAIRVPTTMDRPKPDKASTSVIQVCFQRNFVVVNAWAIRIGDGMNHSGISSAVVTICQTTRTTIRKMIAGP